MLKLRKMPGPIYYQVDVGPLTAHGQDPDSCRDSQEMPFGLFQPSRICRGKGSGFYL